MPNYAVAVTGILHISEVCPTLLLKGFALIGLTAHDSFASSTDPLALARDQEVNVTSQLDLGVRLLQGQVHKASDGSLHFCHTSCLLFDGGAVSDYLSSVKAYLDANPNEVVTMIFTNPDGLSLPDLWEPAFKSSGISDLAYVPPSTPVKQSDWPTLGEMIDSGKRVVVFLDAGANGSDGGQVPFIMPEFDAVRSVLHPSRSCN